MADIGEDHPVAEQERPKLWELIEQTPALDWLLLTKRTATARLWLPERWLDGSWPKNAWFGFSAEDQTRFNERAPQALQVPAALHFVSYEPALGPIDFVLDVVRFDWIIAGGESAVPAKRARPSQQWWFQFARDQCLAAGVPFHFKQWGEWGPGEDEDSMALIGRKVAGRLLDGRTWDEFPASPAEESGIRTHRPAGQQNLEQEALTGKARRAHDLGR